MNADLLNELAIRLYQNNELDKAIECASLLRQIEPDNPRSYKTLGIVNQASEKYAWAINAYRCALLFQPEDFDALFYMAQCYVHIRNFPLAHECLSTCLKLNPSEHQAKELAKLSIIVSQNLS